MDGKDASEVYIGYPVRRGAVTAIHCGDWIPLRPTWSDPRRKELVAALAQNEADVPSYRAISPTIGYLRLPTFSKPNGELLRKLVPTLPESAGQEKLLIVDMRGNGGGDPPIEAMSRWLDGPSVRRAAKFTKVQPNSCLYDALRWGYTQVSSQSLKPPISPQLRGNMQHQLDGLFGAALPAAQ